MFFVKINEKNGRLDVGRILSRIPLDYKKSLLYIETFPSDFTSKLIDVDTCFSSI